MKKLLVMLLFCVNAHAGEYFVTPTDKINKLKAKKGRVLNNKCVKSACNKGENISPGRPYIFRGINPSKLNLEPVAQLPPFQGGALDHYATPPKFPT